MWETESFLAACAAKEDDRMIELSPSRLIKLQQMVLCQSIVAIKAPAVRVKKLNKTIKKKKLSKDEKIMLKR